MITFYPGPSKIYPEVAAYAAEAIRDGIVSQNHRSPEFMGVVAETMRLLRNKLGIPDDYHIAFTSSATECWEIVAQSLTAVTSLHATNGAFGEKWLAYTKKLKCCSGFTIPNDINADFKSAVSVFGITNPEQQKADVLCLVQNETSNGTQVPMSMLARFRQEFSGIIAVDAVSSMAGLQFDWTLADVWFASVQKCFGLPAGLAVLVYSPQALDQAARIGEQAHYNSLLFIHENFRKFQTPYTPNGLGIYLLMRVLQQVPDIVVTDQLIRQRAADWYTFFEQDMAGSPFRPLIGANDPGGSVRSDTVIAVTGTEADIKAVKSSAKQAGIILGSGYGDWKENTFRIANFPAITDEETGKLKDFLRQEYNFRA